MPREIMVLYLQPLTMRHPWPLWICGLLLTPLSAWGQPAERFATDRRAVQMLASAQELLAEKKYSEAFDRLAKLLEAPEDYFWSVKDSEVKTGLRQRVLQVLQELTDEGRQQYVLEFDPIAKQRLQSAVEKSDWSELARVARQFALTPAGQEAAWRISSRWLDQGRPLPAAMLLEQRWRLPALRQQFTPTQAVKLATAWRMAGHPDRAERVLDEARQQFPRSAPELGGERREWQPPAEGWWQHWQERTAPLPIPIAADWRQHRADPQRSAHRSVGGLPLFDPIWNQPIVLAHPRVIEAVEPLVVQFHRDDLPLVPATHALAVGNLVLTRTCADQIVAHDLQTGQRRWTVFRDFAGDVRANDRFEDLLRPGYQNTLSLGQHLFADMTFGTLSSDGVRVFVLEDLDASQEWATGRPRIDVFRAGGRLASIMPNYNRLTAYDLAGEGKLLWEVGGPADPVALELAGVFFLGPPLPVDDVLFVLGELAGEIRLYELSAATGKVRWMQPLARADVSLLEHPTRRRSGLTPSMHEGLLVCPTGAGALAAIDYESRSIVWGIEWEGDTINRPTRGLVGVESTPNLGLGWSDLSLLLAAGRVFCPSTTMGDLCCLDLCDGSVHWRHPRHDALFLGGVVNDRLLVVGRQALHLLSIETGESVIDRSIPIAGPAGQGFIHGAFYYLPTLEGEILTIDFAAGRVVQRVRAPRSVKLGNLIQHERCILNQTHERIDAFGLLADREAKVKEELEKRPTDPLLLALRGQIHLENRKIEPALADLELAYANDPLPRTREMLAQTLLEALETDFDRYYPIVSQREQYLTDRTQRSKYLHLVIQGLQARKDGMGAYARLLELSGIITTEELVEIDDIHQVRRDRWIRRQLDDVWKASTPADRDQLTKLMDEKTRQALQAQDEATLASVRELFADDPRFIDLTLALHRTQLSRDRALAAELTLLDGLARCRPDDRPRLAASLALLLITKERADDGLPLLRRFETEWRDLPVEAGVSGKEWLERLYADKPEFQTLTTASAAWPTGLVQVERLNRSDRLRPGRIPLESTDALFFRDAGLYYEQTRSMLSWRAGRGDKEWSLPIQTAGGRYPSSLHPFVNQGRLLGHLLLFSSGHQALAINMLQPGDANAPELLWRKEILESSPFSSRNSPFRVQSTPILGRVKYRVTGPSGKPVGVVGPLTAAGMFVIGDRRLTAYDPLDGSVLWERTDAGIGVEIIGDEHILLMAHSSGNYADVLSLWDGKKLGRVAIPEINERLQPVGRKFITQTKGEQLRLELRDPWKKRTEWSHSFPPDAMIVTTEPATEVGVFETTGKLTLIDVASGAIVLRADIPLEPNLESIHVLPDEDQFIVVVNSTWPNVDRPFIPPAETNFSIMTHGSMHAFDRKTGVKKWSHRMPYAIMELDQLPGQPVLTYISLRLNADAPNKTPQCRLVGVDRRTGEVILEELSQPALLQSRRLLPDFTRRQVTIELATQRLLLTFHPDK